VLWGVGVLSKARFFVTAIFLAIFSALVLTGCGMGTESSTSPPPPLPSFELSVTPPAKGYGKVTSSPAGINCPSTCSASFPENTQVKLTATASANYSFNGWSGSCSGSSTCSLTVTAAMTATPIFAPAGTGSSVIAYVFTPDVLALKSWEFALLGTGKLQLTSTPAQPMLLTGTTHSLIADLPTSSGFPTKTLQAYAVKVSGTLVPQGPAVTIGMDQTVTLASDSAYVYAATDEGVFGFTDATTGLTPLPQVDLTVSPPAPCTIAQENANQCHNAARVMLSNANAFLLQASAQEFASPVYEINSFTRSNGALTTEQSFAGGVISTGVFAPTPDGNFVYALDLASSHVFRYVMNGNGTPESSILSNGGQLSDGFVQLIVSTNGSFLFAPVSDSSESPRIRVFQINSTSGDLTEVAGSPFVTGEYYLSAASLDPSGHFLLITHAGCDGSPPCVAPGRLVAMSISQTTGALAITDDVQDGQEPVTVTAVAISH
jgi:hypothetical protein